MIDKFRHQHPVARLCALVDVADSVEKVDHRE